MEFKISKKDFSKSIGLCMRAVSSKPESPILKNLLIEAQGSMIFINATDKKIYVRTVNEATIVEDGKVCIEAKILEGLVKKIKKNIEITLKLVEGEVIMEFDDSIVNLKTANTEDFPERPIFEKKSSILLDVKTFAETVKQTSFSTMKNESRPVLEGVLFELEKNILKTVSTDGYRLSMRANKINNEDNIEEYRALILVENLLDVNRIVSNFKKDNVSIGLSENFMSFDVNNVSILTTLMNGEYIDYKNILSKLKPETCAICDREKLLGILERASVFTPKDKISIVELTIQDTKIQITILCENGRIDEVIEASVEGNLMKISFNANFLKAPLSVMNGDRISINLLYSNSPCFIEQSDSKSYKYMVLPMQLK